MQAEEFTAKNLALHIT